MSNIVVTQFWTSNLTYVKYTEAINGKYCEEKGYTYHIESNGEKIVEALEKRAFTWYKPKLILEVLDKYNPDYILFLDADAVVCNFNYRIEDFIDEKFDIICTEDHGPSKMNAGVFLIKNSDWTKKFMREWWESCNVFPGGTNNEVGYYANALWHDQTCFGLLMDNNEDYVNHINIISNDVLNGRVFRNLYSNNFIFHAFSFGNVKNRTIDLAYYEIFNLEKPTETMTLTEIAEWYHTDKHYGHGYFKLVYTDLFEPIKNEVKQFIEIGVDSGQSILLWRDYFKEAKVFGLEKYIGNSERALEDKDLNRIQLIEFDQGDEKQLDDLSKNMANVDVILDDGSHKMRDQQISFAKLFKSLKSGGIYIIEDLHTSLEVVMPEKKVFGWGDPKQTITLDMLKKYQETGIIESDFITSEEMEYLNNNIKSVEVYRSRPDWSITSVIVKK